MTQEEKELLLKDLCARLPYGVIVHIRYETGEPCYGKLTSRDIQWFLDRKIEIIKPYLRPMSSMTDDEINELDEVCDGIFNIYDTNIEVLSMLEWEDSFENILKGNDWLNKKMFDYRGLIPIGLALEAKEDMYKSV